MPLSHPITSYPSPSPYPQVHSLVGLCLYSRLATRFFGLWVQLCSAVPVLIATSVSPIESTNSLEAPCLLIYFVLCC